MIKRGRIATKATRDAPVNPSTLRSRRHRERMKAHDPLRFYSVPLPESTVAAIVLTLTTDRPHDDIEPRAWDRDLALVLAGIITDATKK